MVSKGGFQGLILPVTVLTIQCSAKFIRQVRSIVLEQMNQEYVRGAIARGVTKSKILFSHVLRNAWLPIITLIGIYFGVFLSGAAIVETIFFMARYWTTCSRGCWKERLPCNTS